MLILFLKLIILINCSIIFIYCFIQQQIKVIEFGIMENINLTETKIIDLIIKYNNNNTQKVLFFIEYDCNIKFKIEVSNRINPFNGIMYFYYKLKYNGQLSDIEFFNVINDMTCIYQTDPEKVLMSLFKLLSIEEIENIKNILIQE